MIVAVEGGVYILDQQQYTKKVVTNMPNIVCLEFQLTMVAVG